MPSLLLQTEAAARGGWIRPVPFLQMAVVAHGGRIYLAPFLHGGPSVAGPSLGLGHASTLPPSLGQRIYKNNIETM